MPSKRTSIVNASEHYHIPLAPSNETLTPSLAVTELSQSALIVPENDPDAAPDGGFTAWMQVLMGHLILINGVGYFSSFGVFQSYYESTLNASPSAISWIGSAQFFLLYLIGSFSGRALDGGYYHIILGLGSALQVIGVFTTSISTQYWQLFLAQGICKGVGDGLIFCPTISLVATYFSKNRAVAMAVVTLGACTGGIIFHIIAQQLLYKIGFGWTTRVMGFVILFNAVVSLLIARVRLPPREGGPLIEWAAFKEAPYALFCVGTFLNMWAVNFAWFYVSARLTLCIVYQKLTHK